MSKRAEELLAALHARVKKPLPSGEEEQIALIDAELRKERAIEWWAHEASNCKVCDLKGIGQIKVAQLRAAILEED